MRFVIYCNLNNCDDSDVEKILKKTSLEYAHIADYLWVSKTSEEDETLPRSSTKHGKGNPFPDIANLLYSHFAEYIKTSSTGVVFIDRLRDEDVITSNDLFN